MKKLTFHQRRIWACTRLLRKLHKELNRFDYPYWVILQEINYYEEELERLEIAL